MSKKHLKQKIRDRAAQRNDAIDALLVANTRIRQLEWLITEWADATDERDALPGIAYTHRYIRSIGALRKAVGR